jgi:hypothetical protein
MNANAHQLLVELYAEWRRLTDLEGAAIGADEWPNVARQQQLKLELRDQIVQTTEQWHVERAATETETAANVRFEQEFRPIVADLIQRETRNHEMICERKQRVQSDLAALRQSSTRLRGIQRAYSADTGSRWQSYS